MLVALTALVTGCGSAVTVTRSSSAPPADTLPSGPRAPVGAPGAACQPRIRSVCATPAANGHTVAVAVGWTIETDLHGSSSIWSTPVELGAQLLHRLGDVRRAGGGVSAAYRAVAPGRTELRAFERPLCRPGRACPQLILEWQLHVQVRG
jgi:hypothetical protein